MVAPTELQTLPPRWARFCLELEGFLHETLGLNLQDKRLIVALSGGLDSTSLLLFLKVMRSRWRIALSAAHLNHNLRPEAEAEAQAAAQLCRDLDIPVSTGSSRVATFAACRGLGLEEAGRLLRYRFLFGLKRKQAADFVLTAHHLNDLAEDCLMRQLRGAGWPALAGMPAFEPQTGLLRPLLLTPKKTLAAFVNDLGFSWSEDQSNLQQDRLRNRVRQTILPLLVEENPRFLEAVAQLWRQAEIDRDFWKQTLKGLARLEKPAGAGLLLPQAELAEVHKAVRLRWYKDVLERLGPGQALATSLHKLDAAWQGGHKGKTLQFPGGKRAAIEDRGIQFTGPKDDG